MTPECEAFNRRGAPTSRVPKREAHDEDHPARVLRIGGSGGRFRDPWRRALRRGAEPGAEKVHPDAARPRACRHSRGVAHSYLGADYYQLVAGEYTQQLHPQLPHPTRLWGYADATTGVHRHLGPVIVAQRGTPVRLSVTNCLPPVHPLPVDTSLPGAELAPNRIAVHLHGGHVPWVSDGGPFSWFGADGTYGPSAISAPDMGAPVPGTFNYYYPNDQSARLMWYHDHAIGITRLNAYAGLASAYVLRDLAEATLIASGAIPSNEIPLVIQDKIFKTRPTNGDSRGISGTRASTIRRTCAARRTPLPFPSCVPEFFGDTMLVEWARLPDSTCRTAQVPASCAERVQRAVLHVAAVLRAGRRVSG